jgi:hypothetical protein
VNVNKDELGNTNLIISRYTESKRGEDTMGDKVANKKKAKKVKK